MILTKAPCYTCERLFAEGQPRTLAAFKHCTVCQRPYFLRNGVPVMLVSKKMAGKIAEDVVRKDKLRLRKVRL